MTQEQIKHMNTFPHKGGGLCTGRCQPDSFKARWQGQKALLHLFVSHGKRLEEISTYMQMTVWPFDTFLPVRALQLPMCTRSTIDQVVSVGSFCCTFLLLLRPALQAACPPSSLKINGPIVCSLLVIIPIVMFGLAFIARTRSGVKLR
jgi:hypothetical protein